MKRFGTEGACRHPFRAAGTLLLLSVSGLVWCVPAALWGQVPVASEVDSAGRVAGQALDARTSAPGVPVGLRALEPTVSWEPEEVVQGTLFQVRVHPGGMPLARVEGTFSDEPLHFVALSDGSYVALAGIPVDAEGSEPLQVRLHEDNGQVMERVSDVPVVAGQYQMQRLTVAPEFGSPQPPEIQRRINEESARAMAIARNSHGTPRMWEPPFVAPRDSRITSGFGHGRVFNEQVQSRHMGTDFAGAVGTPVLAPARGRVALVDTFYLGGNVLYLDHGGGLVTGYLHLSAHEVEEGDVVEPGQVIARVGATGRVTGPHLHWLVRYGTITVDGMSLLEIR